jgi:pimeloyl-ACP methyl ester carboxylesterase
VKTFDDLSLHVRVEGQGDARLTVVLSHGWTEDLDFWRYQVRDLRAAYGHDIRIVSYDLRGHGQSDATTLEGATIENLARDLAAIIDTYAPQGDLMLVGHSMGGMTIMELCGTRPELFTGRVVGVLFVNTSAGRLSEVTLGLPRTGRKMKAQLAKSLSLRARKLSRKQRLRAPVIESMIVRRFLFGDTMRLRDHMLICESLINCPPSTMRGFFDDMMAHERHSSLSVLEGTPTRILAGEKDLLTPVTHSQRLAAAIPGARLIISPGCGHMMPLERDEHVSQTIIEMLQAAGATDGCGAG